MKLLYQNILELKKINIDNNYCANLLDCFNEVATKNIAIHKSKKTKNIQDQETYKKTRQKVYWINLGRNIGSEFQDYHYAVVLYESKCTAIIVPLTSKKEHEPNWIIENKDAVVDLGVVEGYPDESKECYACTFMLQTVILTTVKIFQFLHSPYCISGQYVLCRKENLIAREYKKNEGVINFVSLNIMS
jgi:hypothetical protein